MAQIEDSWISARAPRRISQSVELHNHSHIPRVVQAPPAPEAKEAKPVKIIVGSFIRITVS
jgi:hypothetical protein